MRHLIKIILLLAPVFTACSLLPNKDKTPQAAEKVGEPEARPQASIETKQLAAEQEADAVAEVIFAKNRADLGPGEAARLKIISQKFGAKKKIDHILIAAWGDKELPGDKDKVLPGKTRELAEQRGEAVKSFLLEHGGKDIKIEFHNMAEKPGKFAKFISSADARVKKALESSKPSKAIVLLIEKN